MILLLNVLAIISMTDSIGPDFEPRKLSAVKKEVLTAPVQRDALGVERSYVPFFRRPQLHINVRRDLYWRDRRFMTKVQRAVELLARDMEHNPVLVNSWTIGLIKRPDLHKDPVKMAEYVYSLSKPYYLFSSFNGAVSSFKDDNNYNNFHYKGFYALLLLSSKPYKQDFYRGVSSIVEAEKGSYIRFNRFSSTTANKTTAMMYAERKGTPGTLIVFKGVKDATRIDHKKSFPYEDEYLIEPDTQFRVVDVIDLSAKTVSNPGRKIVLTRAYYPTSSLSNTLEK